MVACNALTGIENTCMGPLVAAWVVGYLVKMANESPRR